MMSPLSANIDLLYLWTAEQIFRVFGDLPKIVVRMLRTLCVSRRCGVTPKGSGPTFADKTHMFASLSFQDTALGGFWRQKSIYCFFDEKQKTTQMLCAGCGLRACRAAAALLLRRPKSTSLIKLIRFDTLFGLGGFELALGGFWRQK